ncbi:MICOS complex subunit MIC10 isoform X3 [Pelodiscus sinensis]|uniref:MICOS complex subunit MIC10 isoform X3 n=1 Tax=Pelodiscus sinensis TaxID=13735 RepID=UPI003F6CFD2E
MASENELGRKWDRCLADSVVKLELQRTGWTYGLNDIASWLLIHTLSTEDFSLWGCHRRGGRHQYFITASLHLIWLT